MFYCNNHPKNIIAHCRHRIYKNFKYNSILYYIIEIYIKSKPLNYWALGNIDKTRQVIFSGCDGIRGRDSKKNKYNRRQIAKIATVLGIINLFLEYMLLYL